MISNTSMLNMFRMEYLCLKRSRTLKMCMVLELLIMVGMIIGEGKQLVNVQEICLSQYLGIVLTFRYIYMVVIVSQVFSKDTNKQIFELHFAVGNSRIKLLFAKMVTIWLGQCVVTVIMAIILYLYCLFACGMRGMLLEYIQMVVLNYIPLFIHMLFVIFVDIVFFSPIITMLTVIGLIVSSGLLPYDIIKWVYMSYSNLYLFYEYSSVEMVLPMCLALFGTGIFSVIASIHRIGNVEFV